MRFSEKITRIAFDQMIRDKIIQEVSPEAYNFTEEFLEILDESRSLVIEMNCPEEDFILSLLAIALFKKYKVLSKDELELRVSILDAMFEALIQSSENERLDEFVNYLKIRGLK